MERGHIARHAAVKSVSKEAKENIPMEGALRDIWKLHVREKREWARQLEQERDARQEAENKLALLRALLRDQKALLEQYRSSVEGPVSRGPSTLNVSDAKQGQLGTAGAGSADERYDGGGPRHAHVHGNAGMEMVPLQPSSGEVVVLPDGEWEVVRIGSKSKSSHDLPRVIGASSARKKSGAPTVERVRGKRAREALPAVETCPECAKFVEVLASETGKDQQSLLKVTTHFDGLFLLLIWGNNSS